MAPYMALEKFRSDKTTKGKNLNTSERLEDLFVQMKRGVYIKLGQQHLKNLSGHDSLLKQNFKGPQPLKIKQTAKRNIDNEKITSLPAGEAENQNKNISVERNDHSELSVSSDEHVDFDDSFVTIRRSHLSQNFECIRDVNNNEFNENNTILHSTSKDSRNSNQSANEQLPNNDHSFHVLDTLSEKSPTVTEESLINNCQWETGTIPHASTPKTSKSEEDEEKQNVDSDESFDMSSVASEELNELCASLKILPTGVDNNEKRKESKLLHRSIMKKIRKKERKHMLLKLATALIQLSISEN